MGLIDLGAEEQVFTRTSESEMHPLSLSPLLRSASAAAFSPSPSSAALFPDALRAAGAAALPGLLLRSRPKHRGKQGSLSPHSQRMPYYILDGKEQQGNT